jgi:hypothetical protein
VNKVRELGSVLGQFDPRANFKASRTSSGLASLLASARCSRKAEYPLQIHPRLQEVSAIFAKWSSARKPRSHIPENLWQAAIDLAPFYSIHRIARALRLNYTELKHRIKKRSPDRPVAEFIETDMGHLLSADPCVLGLCSPTGFELRIYNVDRLQPQLETLVDCFPGQMQERSCLNVCLGSRVVWVGGNDRPTQGGRGDRRSSDLIHFPPGYVVFRAGSHHMHVIWRMIWLKRVIHMWQDPANKQRTRNNT